MKKLIKQKDVDLDTRDYLEILDKLLELEKKQEKKSPIKITMCIVCGCGALILIGMLCFMIFKSDLSLDSLLSTLLAFFSIFISIFFYFKADETSTNFYKSSYDFMKDISVTLGKIEERFGEKLNTLNDKISHLDRVSSEKSAEIEDQKEDKDNIINELMKKANLSEEEEARYKKELDEKDAMIEQLKREQYRAEKEAYFLRNRQSEQLLYDRWEPNNEYLLNLLNNGINDITKRNYIRLRRLGFIGENGEVNKEAVMKELSKRMLEA